MIGQGGDAALDAAPSDAEPSNVRFVFVTTSLYLPGDIGGVLEADEKCRQAALSAGLPNAQAPNSYRAWLTDNNPENAPKFRFSQSEDFVYTRSEPLRGVVAIGSSELFGGALRVPIMYTERGAPASQGTACGQQAAAWTGTEADGSHGKISPEYDNVTCNNWTTSSSFEWGISGRSTEAQSRWSRNCLTRCDGTAHLYCFQQ